MITPTFLVINFGKSVLKSFRAAIAAASLAIAVGIWAAPAVAQSAFNDSSFDNGVTRGDAGNAVTAVVSVSAPYTITSIEAATRVTAPSNQKFVIVNLTTNTVIYVSPAKAFPADGATPTFKASDIFPAVTLQPGTNYAIGVSVDQSAFYPLRFAPTYTEGVVTNGLAGNGNLINYANPVYTSGGGVVSPIRLNTVSVPAAVPTLSEWAMILLGLMLAGGAALVIQRRTLSA